MISQAFSFKMYRYAQTNKYSQSRISSQTVLYTWLPSIFYLKAEIVDIIDTNLQ